MADHKMVICRGFRAPLVERMRNDESDPRARSATTDGCNARHFLAGKFPTFSILISYFKIPKLKTDKCIGVDEHTGYSQRKLLLTILARSNFFFLFFVRHQIPI